MKKGFVFLIPKLILTLVMFVVIFFMIKSGVEKGLGASDAANQAVGGKVFPQDCLADGIQNYYCATPNNDRITDAQEGGSIASTRWDGCPEDYAYIVDRTGCEPNNLSKEVEQTAYCCTKILPVQCNLEGLRQCFQGEQKETSEENPCSGPISPANFYYDDSCTENCAIHELGDNEQDTGYSVCAKYNPTTGKVGSVCAAHNGCCGKEDDRRCKYDCPKDYINAVSPPSTDEKTLLNWGCDENNYDFCCQK